MMARPQNTVPNRIVSSTAAYSQSGKRRRETSIRWPVPTAKRATASAGKYPRRLRHRSVMRSCQHIQKPVAIACDQAFSSFSTSHVGGFRQIATATSTPTDDEPVSAKARRDLLIGGVHALLFACGALGGVGQDSLFRSRGVRGSHRLDDVLGHLLGVAEQHHGVVAVEQADCRCRHSPRPASA